MDEKNAYNSYNLLPYEEADWVLDERGPWDCWLCKQEKLKSIYHNEKMMKYIDEQNLVAFDNREYLCVDCFERLKNHI